MAKSTSKPPANDAKQQEVTVLFADISGFTAMSEKLDPEAVTDVMNGCFTDLEGVVTAHRGTVDKYIGDCVMTIFGLGESDSNAPGAVAAAAEILPTLEAFNRRENLPSPLGVHIGLEAGVALVGEIGGREHRTLTVSGTPVTVASRLEDVSDVGQIFVGPQVHRETERLCEYRTLDPITVRDADEPIQIYEFVRHRRLREHIKRDSERRQATVVFASINGFKDLGGRLTPGELSETLNLCFRALESAVQAYGGVIDKYIGETVMALFGVPNAIEDAPKQAINAVIEMRNRLENLSAQKEVPTVLTLSAGVNSGLVIAGEVGGRIKRDFTVMGDTVNLAARLKESAAAGEIFCGPETHRYTRSDFDFAAPTALTLKGKADPVPAYRVLSTREQVYRSGAGANGGRLEAKMVGRDKELGEVTSRLDELVAGEGSMISLVGEAGVGKSRLYAEIARLAAERNLRLVEGRSLSVGRNLRFHPFVDLLRHWTGVMEDDSALTAVVRLRSALEALPLKEIDDVFPFVATLMGLRLDGSLGERIARIDSESLERLIKRAVRELLQALSQSRPVIVVLEDLHWADQSSLQLLESLLPVASDSAVLFLDISRPDSPETSGRIIDAANESLGSRHTTIDLQPLTEEETAHLVEGLLGIEQLPPKLRKWIAAKTEGNPFYVEEVVHTLIDSGAVAEEDGAFRIAKSFDEVEMPGTIQEVIMARVDRLPPATRNVLQVASVIGRSFYYSIIHEILRRQGLLDSECDEDLEDLRERDLLVESETGWTVQVGQGSLVQELEFVFKHALAQETIYNSLLHKVRKEFHQTVGDTIESLFPDRLGDFYGMLAYHFGRAEDLHKAEEYLFLAGEDAARSAASREALSFFREASAIYMKIHGDGGDPARKALLEKNIGMALLNTGELSESIEHFDEALSYFGVSVPRSLIGANGFLAFNAVALLAQLYLGLGRHRTVDDWLTEQQICDIQFNRARAQITSDPVRLLYDSVHAFRRFNEIDMSRIRGAPAMYASAAGMFCYSAISFSASRKALDYTKRLAAGGDIHDQFTYRSMEYIFHYLRGMWQQASELTIEPSLVDEVLRGGQLWDVNTYIGLECDQRLRQGDFEASQRLLGRLKMVADDFGFDFAGANLVGMTALQELEKRNLGKALEAVTQYYTMIDDAPLKVLALGTKAKIQTLAGDLDEAAKSIEAGEKFANPLTTPPWHMSALASARLRLSIQQWRANRGDRSLRRSCRRAIRGALSVAGKTAIQKTEIYALVGTAEWQAGSTNRARRWWQQAIESGNEMKAIPELARVYREMGQSLSSTGDAEGAEALRRADELFASLVPRGSVSDAA